MAGSGITWSGMICKSGCYAGVKLMSMKENWALSPKGWVLAQTVSTGVLASVKPEVSFTPGGQQTHTKFYLENKTKNSWRNYDRFPAFDGTMHLTPPKHACLPQQWITKRKSDHCYLRTLFWNITVNDMPHFYQGHILSAVWHVRGA